MLGVSHKHEGDGAARCKYQAVEDLLVSGSLAAGPQAQMGGSTWLRPMLCMSMDTRSTSRMSSFPNSTVVLPTNCNSLYRTSPRKHTDLSRIMT